MRILFVASLHHPAALQADIDATPPGATPPLFPTSTAQYFLEKALKKRGYTLDVFYRNQPAFGGSIKAQHHQQGLTPAKIVNGLLNRVPPEINPDMRLRNQHLLEKARAVGIRQISAVFPRNAPDAHKLGIDVIKLVHDGIELGDPRFGAGMPAFLTRAIQ